MKAGNMRELLETRKRRKMPKTPLAVFLEEEKQRTGLSWTKIEELIGEADSNIARLRAGQEARPSQLLRLAKVFNRPFWYVMQRAGYTTEMPDAPSTEARRLGVSFAGNADLLLLADLISRLSLDDRQTIIRLVQSMLGDQDLLPAKKPPKHRKKR